MCFVHIWKRLSELFWRHLSDIITRIGVWTLRKNPLLQGVSIAFSMRKHSIVELWVSKGGHPLPLSKTGREKTKGSSLLRGLFNFGNYIIWRFYLCWQCLCLPTLLGAYARVSQKNYIDVYSPDFKNWAECTSSIYTA